MKSAPSNRIFAALCLVELLAILWLAGQRTATPVSPVQTLPPPEAGRQPEQAERAPAAAVSAESDAARVDLLRRNQALESELAALKKQQATEKSQIAFAYGPARDAGRFVGKTFRKMFETAAAQGPKEAQERMADNQINVLSLGPFIQVAEGLENDPAIFAQFQASLIGEVLDLPEQRSPEVEALLGDLKTRSLKLETGSAAWGELNDIALQKITAMLPEDQKQAMKGRIDFLQQYGVLVIPAYSILRAPTPTVAGPAAQTR